MSDIPTKEELYDELEKKEYEYASEKLAALILLFGEYKQKIKGELISFYQKYGTDNVVTYNEARKYVSNKNRKRRIIVLFFAIDDHFNSFIRRVNPVFNNIGKAIIDMEKNFFNVKLDLTNVLNEKWGEDGLNWRTRLTVSKNRWSSNLLSNLKRSFIRGNNLNSVLQDLDKQMITIGKALGRLGLDETTAFNSIARKEIFKALEIKKYKFYSRPDERRCEICGSLHGKVFPITAYEVGITASPIHRNCRCFEIPIKN